MGFIVKKQVETNQGRVYDEFYVRIEGLLIQKEFGTFGITVRHWDSRESAVDCIGTYLEQDTGSPKGQLSVGMKIVGETEMKDWETHFQYYHTSSEEVTVDFEETITEYEEVEYVDFDDDGNEIIAKRYYPYEKIYTGSIDLMYSKRLIENHDGNLWELGYTKLKETYGEIFGSENIVDLI